MTQPHAAHQAVAPPRRCPLTVSKLSSHLYVTAWCVRARVRAGATGWVVFGKDGTMSYARKGDKGVRKITDPNVVPKLRGEFEFGTRRHHHHHHHHGCQHQHRVTQPHTARSSCRARSWQGQQDGRF